MIKDLKLFLKRIEWRKERSLWGGIEIAQYNEYYKRIDVDYGFQIYSYRDLLSFYIHERYVKDFDIDLIFGKMKYFYKKAPPRMDIGGDWYYFAPISWALYAMRTLRKIWMYPVGILWRMGHIDVVPGARIGLWWFHHISIRKIERKKI